MDFFHPMYWAENSGRYTEWGSVYPPMNFLLLAVLKWLEVGHEAFLNAFALRDSSRHLQAGLLIAYALIPAYVVSRSYWTSFSVAERTAIYWIAVTSAPMLFALERGNLVVISLLVLPYVIAGRGFARALAIGLLVNLKPYFALLFLMYVANRRWHDLSLAVLLSGTIFLVTGLLLDQEFLQFLGNLFSFSRRDDIFSIREVLAMPSSISAFSYVLGSPQVHLSGYAIGMSALLVVCIELIKWGVILLALFAVLKSKHQITDQCIVVVIVVLISNVGISVGGYTMIYYFALIPVFLEMRLRMAYLSILFLMAAPLDWLAILSGSLGPQTVFLSGRTEVIQWELGLGSVLRPILNLLLLGLLSAEVLSRERNVSDLHRVSGVAIRRMS